MPTRPQAPRRHRGSTHDDHIPLPRERIICVYLDDQQWAALKAHAAAQNTPISLLASSAITEHLDRLDRTREALANAGATVNPARQRTNNR
jgi:hypothetical protein